MNEHDLYRVMKDIDRKYTDELHQYAAELVTTKRRRETMKQKVKTKAPAAQFLPWKFGIGVAVAACAAIAVFIGAGIISMDKQQQMQVGMSGGTSVAEQLSEREPLPIEVRAADGIDIDMNLPEGGKAEVLRSINDAQAWIDLLKQSGEHGRATGEGFHPCLEILENEKQYLDRDIIICAVPYHFVQGDSGVAQHAFFGGTITESGKLTVDTGMVTVSKEMRPLMLQDTEAYCICFTVPKNTVPEITGFTFNNQIYDCTAPLPDDIRSELDMTEYLAELPEYQGYAQRFTNELYLRWIEDDIQTADATDKTLPEDCTEVQSVDAAHEPVEIIEKLISSGGNDSTMMKLPPEGAVQVLRSVEDAEACCQYSDENVAGQPFDFRNKLTEDVFAEYDVLYFAFKDEQKPQYCYSVDLAGGCIAADGSTLKLDFHALMFDPAHLPSDWCSVTEPDWNTYYFYTVPKNTLPDLNAIELSFEEYPLGEIPDEILANPHENVGVTDDGKTIMALQEYLETTKEYLNWLNSVPKPKYISWEDNTQLP